MLKTLTKPNIISINPQQLQNKIHSNSHLLVDVREADEYNLGHLKGAILRPSSQYNPHDWLGNDRVILYCRSGKRSHMIAEKLKDLGINEIMELEGGIMAWQQHNLPVEKCV